MDLTIVDMVVVIAAQETQDDTTYPVSKVYRLEFESFDHAEAAVQQMANGNHVVSAAPMQNATGAGGDDEQEHDENGPPYGKD